MSIQYWRNVGMKNFCNYVLTFLLIFITLSSKVDANAKESMIDTSQIIITNKYAERFCNTKADNFFLGLENEKILKYSYYKYIGLMNEEIFSVDMYKPLIKQIKDKCSITKEEEKEINELLLNKT
tara:strand:+ start:140 stop:514 length:375 start_codon:yes stop_codon:yes gene_type:complete